MMKYIYSFCLSISLVVLIYATMSAIDQSGQSKRKRTSIDRIEAIIYHPEGKKVIATSDIKPNLDGNPRTLEQIIFENLMLIDAQQVKQLEVTDAEVDKYINQMQMQNNLTRDDIIELFKQSGYTYEEGQQQLKNQLLADRVISYRVKNNIMVTDEDVATFYKEHPEYTDAVYEISQAEVPYGEGLKALRKLAVEQAIESGEIKHAVNWSKPIKLKEHDISAEKSFIKDLAVGDVILFSQTDNSFIVLQMISKTPQSIIPLDQVEEDVRRALLNQRFDTALRAYRDKLLKTTRVRYTSAA